MDAPRAAAVQKIVSQHVVNLRLLVRATRTCTRTSASVRTSSRHAATAAVPHSHAVLQLLVATGMATVVETGMATVVETGTATVVETGMAAMQMQAAVLQLLVQTVKVAATVMVVATAAMQTQAAVLQLLVATVAEATLAAKAATAATTIAAILPS